MIFIWDNFSIRYIALAVFLNIVVLFTLEYTMPGLIPEYPSESTRIIDSYSTLLIVLGFFAILIITVRNNYLKQTFMAQRSDKLKTAFLANMSHEIRTPLNALIGFSQLLIERDLPKDKKERYSQLITENGDYLMKLISDILDISMIESGQLKIIKHKSNLNNLLKHIYTVHNEVLHTKTADKVELKLEIPPKTVYAEVDEMRLKQIIFNLIGNAIKYTAKGYIKFGYTTSGNEILFFVEDTGCGIKEEFQPEVFDRFVRHEEAREVKTTRGSGIGLSLSKELVNILGGKIWFNSKYKEGTTFYFSLPYSPTQQE
jgi:signal transduction histidine kinase